jgi:hypothetical protein
MQHWHPHIVRAERPGAVRQWADLEGKSPTMRDDLYQKYAEQPAPILKQRSRIVLLAELLVAALDTWWKNCS